MTRINCIPPKELTDKHLLAEYRELPRIFRLARHCSDAPKEYCLGTGHMKFFFNKLTYLVKRQYAIVNELKARGFNLSYSADSLFFYHEDNGGSLSKSLWNDWYPDEKAKAINRVRIQDRLNGIKYSKA